ncbi:hypothetical protein P154DRAFT_213731 [Amniculicola lignicola CBS 123094]|uniref:Uncharacterized protein n=1 Tax=Amniculicola lignicola CBS 123094 TaxID=1392246 RepID=A0A6A5WDR8_9PLEO|nr:hypothetical protein P154DRAFT_213731 [Amniculicola lignicola CBS 123094]
MPCVDRLPVNDTNECPQEKFALGWACCVDAVRISISLPFSYPFLTLSVPFPFPFLIYEERGITTTSLTPPATFRSTRQSPAFPSSTLSRPGPLCQESPHPFLSQPRKRMERCHRWPSPTKRRWGP